MWLFLVPFIPAQVLRERFKVWCLKARGLVWNLSQEISRTAKRFVRNYLMILEKLIWFS